MGSRDVRTNGSFNNKPSFYCYFWSRISPPKEARKEAARKAFVYPNVRSKGEAWIGLPGLSTGALIFSPIQRTAAKITWLTDTPIWVDQWPLLGEKLKAAQELVQVQPEEGILNPLTVHGTHPFL